MGFKEIIRNFGGKNKERKEMIRQLDERMRVEEAVLEKRKSSNQRELEGYMREIKEAKIKSELERVRKARQHDINFGHNPLDAKNIVSATKWHVLKEKNQFAGNKNIFSDNRIIHQSNPNMFKNNRRMFAI